jgi:hypothetical protein
LFSKNKTGGEGWEKPGIDGATPGLLHITLILHYKSQTPSRLAGFLPAGKTKLMVKDQE